MACRPLVRRVWALTMKDRPCLPSSTTSICSSLGHPRTARPARFLSRSLCLTPARGVSFNVQDNDDFTERVINSQVPVLIDFHAQWCGPCKILGPRMEKAVAKHQGKVTMAKVDIDEHTDLAIEYGVSAVPTVIAMRGGSVVDQFVGIKDEDQLESFISGLIGH